MISSMFGTSFTRIAAPVLIDSLAARPVSRARAPSAGGLPAQRIGPVRVDQIGQHPYVRPAVTAAATAASTTTSRGGAQ